MKYRQDKMKKVDRMQKLATRWLANHYEGSPNKASVMEIDSLTRLLRSVDRAAVKRERKRHAKASVDISIEPSWLGPRIGGA